MNLIAKDLEFRGLSSRMNKDGETVYNVALETKDSEQVSFYLGKDIHTFVGLKKGDIIDLEFVYEAKWDKLKCVGVHKND